MKKKPFYRSPIAYFQVKRKRWNPMRLVFGDYYWSSDPMKIDININDIKITTHDTNK